MSDLLVLALMLDGPKHGYQLKREAGWILGRGALHNNIVYPLLRRFLEAGWVRRKSVPGERGQTRHEYALTSQGKRTFFLCASQFAETEARSPEAFHLLVGVFHVLPPRLRSAILQARERYLEGRDARLEALRAGMELGRFGQEVVGYLHRQIAMEQDWIRHLRQIAPRRQPRRKQ
jgi:DNA-binding PadR family transcriptional regulator